MPTIIMPDYAGGSLVNLAAELEHLLGGKPPSPRLHEPLAAELPESPTYVLVLFDGLGAAQLDHPRASALRESLVARIDAAFPATTTVNLATLATGLPPSQHGLLGYQLWMPDIDEVANTIKWTTLWGDPLDYDTSRLLPSPNLWERLGAVGAEPITVQPAHFATSGLSAALYRGCRFEGVTSYQEQVEATIELSSVPGRLVLTYFAAVDYAAHVAGQASMEYEEAVATADWLWSSLAVRLPANATLIGTADHGHVDYPKGRQIRIGKKDHAGRTFYGDGRAMFVRGDGAELAEDLPATWIPLEDARDWWGPAPYHEQFAARQPDGILVADDDHLLLHRFSDDRMIGNHGALTPAELRIPLLVASRR